MKLLLASTSSMYGENYLEYLLPELEKFFDQIDQILFIPYARPGGITYEDYTAKVASAFSLIGKKISGIHEHPFPKEAILQAKAIFTGGGNTFLLVKTLYENDLMDVMRESIQSGTAYLGTSAGSNLAGVSMKTTNDMPIVYPPSFETLGLISFNLNPHYLDPIPGSTHNGETRETRIKEFHSQDSTPVLGLREGSWLEQSGNALYTGGSHTTRLFRQGMEPIEIAPNTLLS